MSGLTGFGINKTGISLYEIIKLKHFFKEKMKYFIPLQTIHRL